MIGIYYLVDR